jgi:aquaporin Z
MNPAMTLTFLRLRKISGWDACFYVVAQFIGGTLGVLLVAALWGDAMAAAQVNYIVTVPGQQGVVVALLAEIVISAILVFVVLVVSNSTRYSRYTGIVAGILVATFITFEAPLSGMSINPARSFASALPSGVWTDFWIYIVAPIVGMQAGASLYLAKRRHEVGCGKLLHPGNQRCIHCGYDPVRGEG